MVQTLIPQVGPEETAQRLLEYLERCGLPAPLVESLCSEILAQEVALPAALRMARLRWQAWLDSQPPFDPARSDTLDGVSSGPQYAAVALMPAWSPTPPPAVVEMPMREISLRTLGSYVQRFCNECIPLAQTLKQRFLCWLRSL